VTGIRANNIAKDEWLKHGISPEEAELDFSIQLPAGTETSISTIRATILYLMSSPGIYQKLKREIADGVREGRISSPVTNDEAKNLPYLQVGCVNMSMKINHPNPQNARREQLSLTSLVEGRHKRGNASRCPVDGRVSQEGPPGGRFHLRKGYPSGHVSLCQLLGLDERPGRFWVRCQRFQARTIYRLRCGMRLSMTFLSYFSIKAPPNALTRFTAGVPFPSKSWFSSVKYFRT
jgi:hypothetical protein